MDRILRNLFHIPLLAQRTCSDEDLRQITAAIKRSEKFHGCEIVFIVEGALDLVHLMRKMTAHDRALDLFGRFRVWDTEDNNGILIYVLLSERKVEIICDRAVKAKLQPEVLSEVAGRIVDRARKTRLVDGVIEAVELLSTKLAPLFPPQNKGGNEVKDEALRLK